ncbi:XRE-family transcriptional regulator [Kutzneria sp. 744]|nr:XRE-family transcriptional regulator [Kutzneria sp. 744]
MPRRVGASDKANRDTLRDQMRGLGCSVAQIVAEMSRRFNLRPRAAWRHALGLSQWQLAQRYNADHPAAGLRDNRVSEYESWPHGGMAPPVRYLANLAVTYGHGCTPSQLVDADDMQHLSPSDRLLFAPSADGFSRPVRIPYTPNPLAVEAASYADVSCTTEFPARRNPEDGGSRSRRRIVRCDAAGLPTREEVAMAAEESARFRRFSATTNIDDDVLEQLDADVADIASCYLTDPPATVFARLIGGRDDVFALIEGRQSPRHAMHLHKIGGQMCALLAHASADLGHAHAANTHARTALHCAEVAGYGPLHVYTRWVQSNVAYWAGRYKEAAALVEAALPFATTGTSLLRLSSQQARISAARTESSEMNRALAVAGSAPIEPSADEPGVFAFPTGKAAYYASEAYRGLGGLNHLDAAVTWAQTAVQEFAGEREPNVQFVAAARIDLAGAHLARGDLDAVGEHLAKALSSTVVGHRTVPVISRARALNTTLTALPTADPSKVAALRSGLDEFCATPAAVPAGLDNSDTN